MAAGRVSLARRNLFQDHRRALLAVTGVGASLVLTAPTARGRFRVRSTCPSKSRSA